MPGAEETVNGVSRFRKRGRISSSSTWDSNSNSARDTCSSESSYLLLARQSQAPGSLPSAPFAEGIQEELGEEGDLGEDDHSAGPVLPKPHFMKSRRCGAAPGQSGSTARSAREDPRRGRPLGDRRLRGGGGVLCILPTGQDLPLPLQQPALPSPTPEGPALEPGAACASASTWPSVGRVSPQRPHGRRSHVQLGGPDHTRGWGWGGDTVRSVEPGWSGKASGRRRACGGAFGGRNV